MRAILDAAWEVAEEVGWARFSVEQVAAKAELGRATVYGYFAALDKLVAALANEALESLSAKLAEAAGLREALDVPVRFAQANPPAFALLFPSDPREQRPFGSTELDKICEQARLLIARLTRLSAKAGEGEQVRDRPSTETFLSAVAIAGAVVPELRASTTLRRRWQDFCLKSDAGPTGSVKAPPDSKN